MSTEPINPNDAIKQYTAYAGQVLLPWDFWIETPEDLELYVDGVLKTYGVDYSIDLTRLKNDNGGNITAASALAGGEKITVRRNAQINRDTYFSEGGGGSFRGDSINLQFNRIIAMLQDRARDISRSLRLSTFSSYVGSLTLPDPSPGKGLRWNDAGNGFTNTAYNLDDYDQAVNDILDASDVAVAAAAQAQAAAAAVNLPTSTTGQANKMVVVKSDETGYAFATRGALAAKSTIATADINDGAVTSAKLDGAILTSVLAIPIGGGCLWFDDVLPDGYWIWANGGLLNRTTHATLFARWGTRYGAGNGVTTFGSPDLRQFFLVGKGTMGGAADPGRITSASLNGANANTLGGTMGEETHTLTASEMAHNHAISGSSNLADPGSLNYRLTSLTTGGVQNVTATAHNNLPPGTVVNYIIRYA